MYNRRLLIPKRTHSRVRPKISLIRLRLVMIIISLKRRATGLPETLAVRFLQQEY